VKRAGKVAALVSRLLNGNKVMQVCHVCSAATFPIFALTGNLLHKMKDNNMRGSVCLYKNAPVLPQLTSSQDAVLTKKQVIKVFCNCLAVQPTALFSTCQGMSSARSTVPAVLSHLASASPLLKSVFR
jgi:hypothetical protein